MFPFNLIFEYIRSLVAFIFTFIRPDQRRYLTDPLDDVIRFIGNFEEAYGSTHPTFYRGTYSSALNDAKKELKFLLVYLHGDHHQDTKEFCESVLAHPVVISYINRNNLLFWACSVNLPEGYRVSQALHENTYPFLALIALKDNNRMTVVRKYEGKTTVERLLSQIQQGIEDNEGSLVAARLDRQERSMNQLLRQEQDEAYLESLRVDREKERKKKEEKQKQDEEEKQRKEKEMDEIKKHEQLLKLRVDLAAKIPEEPDAKDPNAIRILIKLPDGHRFERKFLKTHSIKYLYYFVFCQEQSPLNFQITTNFPRKELPCKPPSLEDPECNGIPPVNDQQSNDAMNRKPNSTRKEPPTFEEIGLGKSEMLFVHDLEA